MGATLCHVLVCSSRKYPYPLQRRLTEIPKGIRVSKDQFFSKGKYGTKIEFPAGMGGFKLKELP